MSRPPPGSMPPPRLSRRPPPPRAEPNGGEDRPPSRNASRLIRFAPAIAASAAVLLVIAARPLGAVPRGIALGAVGCSWAAAILVRRVALRVHATVVFAILSLSAAGQVEGGVPYAVGAIAALVACLASLRASRLAPARPGQARTGLPRVTLLLFLAGAPVTVALLVGLPWLAIRVERRVNALFGVDGDDATAFSSTMVLGATRGMLQSDAIVLRIDGERPEYLRGAVYDRYDGRYWLMSGNARNLGSVRADATPERATTRITLARGAAEGADMRWFLPAGACDLGTAAGRVDADGFGVARRGPRAAPGPITIGYRTSGCLTPPAAVLPPSPSDLELRRELRAQLAPIARAFTANATTEREKLAAIKRQLAGFEYSLAVSRDEALDPVFDFLTIHKAGHCEMFAAAMVLLARAEGIPARVVGGYRVSEVNRFTGQTVVRDRNAHAWVEAFTDGAWRAWDPTPVSEGLAPRATTFDNVADLVSVGFDRVAGLFSRLGTEELLGIFGGVLVLLVAVRWAAPRLRGLRGRRKRATAPADLPHPAFTSLEGALALAGHPRPTSEPLETFARRLRGLDAPWARDAATAVGHYADLRYGGLGEEPAVVAELEQAARRVGA